MIFLDIYVLIFGGAKIENKLRKSKIPCSVDAAGDLL